MAEEREEPDQLTPEGGEAEGEEGQLFEHHVLNIDPGQKPVRIDVFLSTMLRNLSRTRVKSFSKAGALKVNGKIVKASYKVRPEDQIFFLRPYAPRPDLVPEEIPLDIPYEDDDIIMVNKKPGMVVHPGVGHRSGTLMHALLHHCKLEALPGANEENPYLGHYRFRTFYHLSYPL